MLSTDLGAREYVARGRVMATDVYVRAVGVIKDEARQKVVDRALAVFFEVEETCTRFDPASPLMQINRRPSEWGRVPPRCYDALEESWRAYERTEGRFDPRVFTDLVALGYDRSFESVALDAPSAGVSPRRRLAPTPWCPRFRSRTRSVLLGGAPVDLGGIGKGVAIRWASEELRATVPDHLIDAGGDCYCGGRAPGGGPWLVGVEDPHGGSEPRLVLALSDLATATSSTRVRRWTRASATVHHLIDPRTGLPGGEGLSAVTVVGSDPAQCEVWSKVLFLEGGHRISAEAARRDLAAFWVTTTGRSDMSKAMEPYVVWRMQ